MGSITDFICHYTEQYAKPVLQGTNFSKLKFDSYTGALVSVSAPLVFWFRWKLNLVKGYKTVTDWDKTFFIDKSWKL